MKAIDHKNSRIELFLICLVFLWFIFQVIYFAYSIRYSISPDEAYHLQIILLWSSGNGFSLPEGPEIYQYGAVSRFPFLYHAFMGWVLKLNAFGVDPLDFVRGVNVIFSALAFWVNWKLLQELTENTPIRVSILMVMASTLMFVFVSGMVSYDNLVFLLASLCLLFFARFLNSGSLHQFVILHVFATVGCLVKVTFLPLALFMTAVSIVVCRRSLSSSAQWQSLLNTRRTWLPSALLIILVTANLNFYLTNIIKYKGIYPSCNNVLGEEICTKHYPQSIRDTNLAKLHENRERMPFPEFFRHYWKSVEETTIGILGHESLQIRKRSEKYPHRTVLYASFASLLLLGIRRDWNFFRNQTWLIFLACFIWYAGVVMLENYSSYLRLGQYGVGLQGRYIFPVLLPMLYAICRPIFYLAPQRFQWVLLIIIISLMSTAGFAVFCRYAGPEWFR